MKIFVASSSTNEIPISIFCAFFTNIHILTLAMTLAVILAVLLAMILAMIPAMDTWILAMDTPMERPLCQTKRGIND